MLAINEMTADAMLGTPDSDLWHNVDDLLHNVNDLMSRLDQRQGDGGSENEEQAEADGVFFTRDAAANTPYDEVQASPQPDFTHVLNVWRDDKQNSYNYAARASLLFLPASSEHMHSAEEVQGPVALSQTADSPAAGVHHPISLFTTAF